MRLHHLRIGSGEPLVLLHGLGGDLRTWLPVLPLLSPKREVVAVDLPGFGRSPPLDGDVPDVAALARAVASFLDVERLGHPHLAGNALGGWIALELARLGVARSVTALSPAGFWTPAGRRWVRVSHRAARGLARSLLSLAPRVLSTRAGRTLFLGSMFGRPSAIPASKAVAAVHAFADAPGFDATLHAMLTRDGFRPFAVDPGVPILVAWGGRDRVLRPSQAREAARRIPSARCVTLERCGHVPTWDDPDAVAAVLLAGSAGAARAPVSRPERLGAAGTAFPAPRPTAGARPA